MEVYLFLLWKEVINGGAAASSNAAALLPSLPSSALEATKRICCWFGNSCCRGAATTRLSTCATRPLLALSLDRYMVDPLLRRSPCFRWVRGQYLELIYCGQTLYSVRRLHRMILLGSGYAGSSVCRCHGRCPFYSKHCASSSQPALFSRWTTMH